MAMPPRDRVRHQLRTGKSLKDCCCLESACMLVLCEVRRSMFLLGPALTARASGCSRAGQRDL
jgi:hypothetical protein